MAYYIHATDVVLSGLKTGWVENIFIGYLCQVRLIIMVIFYDYATRVPIHVP